MDKTGTILLVVLAALCAGLPEVTGVITLSPSGEHEVSLYCSFRNYQGESVFYRVIDDRNVTLSQGSKYFVMRCNRTTSDVQGEDSVLIITEAEESDSGTYGCALNVKSIINWAVSKVTDVTVKPAYPGEDHTHSMSLTTQINKEQGTIEQSNQGANNEQSSDKTVLGAVATPILSFVVVILLIAVAVLSWKYRELKNHREVEADTTQTSRVTFSRSPNGSIHLDTSSV
ncbi:uncharacterized protein LOC117291548 isoform X2 [Asterias rubens]|uniref:uncharacterized protein LOC117291548 isoform X2 n=1 Tax=Asterias rubens TaxID=7604 RepID=UPI0014557B3B|nr:uncharacterized protein LOC117291548 isoform X2 [Asterias rubens]